MAVDLRREPARQTRRGTAIAIDAQDNVFVTGSTSSFGASNDLLMLLYNAATGQLVDQGTFDVPTELAKGQVLALDSAQNLIVAGTTRADPSGFMDFLTVKYESPEVAIRGNPCPRSIQVRRAWGACPPTRVGGSGRRLRRPEFLKAVLDVLDEAGGEMPARMLSRASEYAVFYHT